MDTIFDESVSNPGEPGDARRSRIDILQKAGALLILASFAALLAWQWYEIVAAPFVPSSRKVAILVPVSLLAALAIYGVARDRVWGRWVVLPAALGGTVFLTLGNLLLEAHWIPLLVAGAMGLLAACLIGSRMAKRYELQLSSKAPFTRKNGRTDAINWGTMLTLAVLPSLFIFVLVADRPAALPIRIGAVVTAGAIAVGASLLLRQRTAGLLLLAAGGLSVFVLGGVLLNAGLQWDRMGPYDDSQKTVFFTLNWGVGAIGTALLLGSTTGPVLRFLRR